MVPSEQTEVPTHRAWAVCRGFVHWAAFLGYCNSSFYMPSSKAFGAKEVCTGAQVKLARLRRPCMVPPSCHLVSYMVQCGLPLM